MLVPWGRPEERHLLDMCDGLKGFSVGGEKYIQSSIYRIQELKGTRDEIDTVWRSFPARTDHRSLFDPNLRLE